MEAYHFLLADSFKTQGQEESAYENALEPRVRPNPPHKKGCLSDDRGKKGARSPSIRSSFSKETIFLPTLSLLITIFQRFAQA